MIHFKTGKTIAPSDGIDLHMGLYYLILEQTYHKALQRLSLIYLRQGQKINFDVTSEHHQKVRELIGELALKLRADQEWEPEEGQHCDRCEIVLRSQRNQSHYRKKLGKGDTTQLPLVP